MERKQKQLVRSDTELHSAVREILPTGPNTNMRLVDVSLRRLAARFGEDTYSVFLNLMFHIPLSPSEAKGHWVCVMEHHAHLRAKLGAAIDFRVSSLDYFTRKVGLISNPTVMETEHYIHIYRDTITDEMTGLFNFRYFRETLDREIARADRYQTPLSLLFFDVDHFKKFNDVCGHQAGDAVLQMVGEIIAGSVRSSDVPCRYGGEEFAIVAPETPKQGALLLAERIRKAVSLLEIPESKEFGQITISGGISCFPVDGDTGQILLEKADRALYRAKEMGRDRIETETGDRRRAPRWPVALPGVYGVLPKHRESISTKNVSRDGFLLETSGPLAPGSMINLEVELTGTGEPVRCLGRVTYVQENEGESQYQVGVAIMRMSATDRGRYDQFIMALAA